MTRVAAILPCRGRAEQTARNVQRLLATAGNVDWRLVCVCDNDRDVYASLDALDMSDLPLGRFALDFLAEEHRRPRAGYWNALAHATGRTDAPLLVNLANDLLPGAQWLARAVAAYDRTGGRLKVLGFNDGINSTAHFLIERAWLMDTMGWPVWYDHMCGDTEIVERATAAGVYGTLPWAVLYHDHEMVGAPNDAVYEEGKARWAHDRALFEQRKAAGWPAVN
jgi:hypothetical protein